MTKRQKNIFLTVVASLVWGYVIFRFIFNYYSSNESVVIESELPIKPSALKNEGDSFTINANYRDPFGNTIVQTINSIRLISSSTINISQKPASSNWPKLAYKGLIKNEGSKTPCALVQMDGKSTLIKAGQSINSITLLSVTRDSIIVRMNNEKRIIKR